MPVAEAYDPGTRWGRAFGYVDRVNYSPPEYKHRGQDIRKLNATKSASVVTDVVSLSAGRISHQYTAPATGREIVVDTARKVGRYEIHCHNAYFSTVGTDLSAGEAFSRNATATEKPGTGWGGPHDHLVISDYPDAAHTPSRHVYDPRPFIITALASAAGSNSRPFDPEEDDMPGIAEIFHTPIVKSPDGPDMTLAQFMQNLPRWAGEATWAQTLAHPLAVGADGKPLGVAAGDFLRFEPAEHANTRTTVAKISTGDVDYAAVAAEIAARFPQLDVHAFAIAAADEADRREKARLAADVTAG